MKTSLRRPRQGPKKTSKGRKRTKDNDGESKQREMSYLFLFTLDAAVDLGEMLMGIMVEIIELVFAEDGKLGFGVEFALPDARTQGCGGRGPRTHLTDFGASSNDVGAIFLIRIFAMGVS